MKKFIFTLIMLFMCGAAYGQSPIRNLFLHSMNGGDTLVGKTDSISKYIQLERIDGYFSAWAYVDTGFGDSDSCQGKIPKITIEYAYTNQYNDTLYDVDSSQVWFTVTDSIPDVETSYTWRIEPRFTKGMLWRIRLSDADTDAIVAGRRLRIKFGVYVL